MNVWDDVVGQSAATAQLQAAAAPGSSPAQSWLLAGPPGSGRSTAARAFAATVQCEHRTGCGQCQACRTVLAGTHPDVTVVATDTLSISKDEVRQLVLTAQRAPATGRHRVLIVEDADRMSPGTFNVLLKAIEEPPPATIWMLCAPSAHDLAPTIRSRCRLVTLTVPAPEVVAQLLHARDGIDQDLAEHAARAAQGHIGLALRYARDADSLRERDQRALAVLELRSVGAAVLLAQQVVDSATAEARDHAQTVSAQERERFLRSAGIEDASVPASLRPQLKALDEDAKRRETRLVRDVIDRYLMEVHSLFRDLLTVQIDSGSELVNIGIEQQIRAAAGHGSGEDSLALLDALHVARERIAGNVPPILALEAFLGRVAVVIR